MKKRLDEKLRCEEHPEQETFVKVVTTETPVNAFGATVRGEVLEKIRYVCPRCDDLVAKRDTTSLT